MDFMLPSDETMKKMAKEYAKIKCVGAPPKACVFSVEEDEQADKIPPKKLKIKDLSESGDISPKRPKNG